LSAFRGENTPKQSTELAALLNIPRSSAYQIIQSLVADGYLEKVGHRQVRLGPKVVELLIASRQRQHALRPICAQAHRTYLWNPQLAELVNCCRFRRSPPYRIGFSNASVSNPWRVALLQGMQRYVEQHSKLITKFIVSDAQDDPQKQIADVKRMLQQKVDLLLISCSQAEPLDSVLCAATAASVPVVVVDRRPLSDECFVTYVSASDIALGRVTAQWLVEKLNGEGEIFMLAGIEGVSLTQQRRAAAMEVFFQHPGITVTAMRYTEWREDRGREIVAALIAENGVPDGVWCDSGLQGAGSMQAFLDLKDLKDLQGTEKTIPPHTGGDINRTFQLAVEHKIPLAAVEYPASMGARAVEAGLDVLAGKVIPRRIEVHSSVVVSRGHETNSVHADLYADDYVRWDRPADFVASGQWRP
jgi:ribose transport system substrate-binding protein